MTSQNGPKEYTVSVNSDDIREAIRMTASALYAFVEEALATRQHQETDDWEFEMFAHDVLGVLTRHADELSKGESSWAAGVGEECAYD